MKNFFETIGYIDASIAGIFFSYGNQHMLGCIWINSNCSNICMSEVFVWMVNMMYKEVFDSWYFQQSWIDRVLYKIKKFFGGKYK